MILTHLWNCQPHPRTGQLVTPLPIPKSRSITCVILVMNNANSGVEWELPPTHSWQPGVVWASHRPASWGTTSLQWHWSTEPFTLHNPWDELWDEETGHHEIMVATFPILSLMSWWTLSCSKCWFRCEWLTMRRHEYCWWPIEARRKDKRSLPDTCQVQQDPSHTVTTSGVHSWFLI